MPTEEVIDDDDDFLPLLYLHAALLTPSLLSVFTDDFHPWTAMTVAISKHGIIMREKLPTPLT